MKRTAPMVKKMTAHNLRRKLESWIKYHEKRAAGVAPTDTQRLAAIAFEGSTVSTRQDGEAWLFRNPHRTSDAFEGLVDKWLGHRLGLRILPGEKRLTLSFRAVYLRRPAVPRFLDATWSYLPLWHWSGLTKPLSGTPSSLAGLEEIVAVPPKLKEINARVRRVVLA